MTQPIAMNFGVEEVEQMILKKPLIQRLSKRSNGICFYNPRGTPFSVKNRPRKVENLHNLREELRRRRIRKSGKYFYLYHFFETGKKFKKEFSLTPLCVVKLHYCRQNIYQKFKLCSCAFEKNDQNQENSPHFDKIVAFELDDRPNMENHLSLNATVRVTLFTAGKNK